MPNFNLYSTLNTVAENLQTASSSSTTWDDYKATAPSNTTVNLTNADFQNGTLRIKTGNCVFKLTEDVTIQPGTAPDFFPEESDEFAFPPYQLGWFAGITCETSEPIVIDLNGFTLEQSELFALQQRFYALIEIGNQPFVEKQGPSQFGALRQGKNITIRNGRLGRSSHHGIHSPGGAENILLEDLQIEQFEVAGIHLNGAKSAVIKNCHIGPIRLDVPVIGTYSQCRFIRPFVAAIDENLTLPFVEGAITGKEILQDLDNVLQNVYNNIAAGQAVDKDAPECSFVANTKSLNQALAQGEDFNEKSYYQPSGGAYGLVLNKEGVAVNGFLMSQMGSDVGNSNILVDGLCVDMIKSATIEVVGVSNPNAKEEDGGYGGGGVFQVGPVGDVFRIDDLTTSSGRYQSTALSNAQLFVALRGAPGSKGTTNITSQIINWAISGNKKFGKINIDTILTNPPTNDLYRLYNGDAMAHVDKGNIGIWLQGANDVEVTNSQVSNISQNRLPSRGRKEDYPAPKYISHPGQKLPYYGGGTSRGLALSSCKNITLSKTHIGLISSMTNNSIGIDYIGDNTQITSSDLSVGGLKSINKQQSTGDQKPNCCPMRIRSTTKVSNLTITGTCPAKIVDSS